VPDLIAQLDAVALSPVIAKLQRDAEVLLAQHAHDFLQFVL
jgi:hypothetical protein